jgi:hypothetical protein
MYIYIKQGMWKSEKNSLQEILSNSGKKYISRKGKVRSKYFENTEQCSHTTHCQYSMFLQEKEETTSVVQSLRLPLPNRPFHLRIETDPVSKMLCPFYNIK